jgi:hypothetical protein
MVRKIETVIVTRSALLHKLVLQQQKSNFTSESVKILHFVLVHSINSLPSLIGPTPRETTDLPSTFLIIF